MTFINKAFSGELGQKSNSEFTFGALKLPYVSVAQALRGYYLLMEGFGPSMNQLQTWSKNTCG